MSREIKFRAWDKKDEVMVAFDHSDFSVVSERVRNYALGFDSEGNYRRQDNITYMQFTGLLDRHGVEIYEGDIVQLDAIAGIIDRIGTVDYGEAEFVTKIDDDVDSLSSWKSIEVIGNIYEHGHLLENESKE